MHGKIDAIPYLINKFDFYEIKNTLILNLFLTNSAKCGGLLYNAAIYR